MPVSKREYDHNGWPEIKGNPISKVGVFPYLGKSIDKTLEPDKIYMVYRPAEELSHPECMESFKLLPWVDIHPRKLLGPEAAGRMPAEEKGVEGVIGQDIYFSDGVLRANIKLFSDSLAGKIDEDGIRELSVGYGCTYDLTPGVFNGQQYDAVQRNIRGNHLASVPQGRMGPDVAVLDHQLTFTMDAKEITMPEMTPEEKKMKECADRAAADGFKRYSKDAEEEEKEKKEKEASDKMAKDKAAKDAEEEEKKKEKEAADKTAKDADTKEKDGDTGMDAALSEIAALKSEVASLRTDALKSVMSGLKRRDELAAKISPFVGAFDASEMTVEDVAQYGVKKLELNCDKGSEIAALDGFLHNRKPESDDVGYSFDAAAPADFSGTAALDKLFKKAA